MLNGSNNHVIGGEYYDISSFMYIDDDDSDELKFAAVNINTTTAIKPSPSRNNINNKASPQHCNHLQQNYSYSNITANNNGGDTSPQNKKLIVETAHLMEQITIHCAGGENTIDDAPARPPPSPPHDKTQRQAQDSGVVLLDDDGSCNYPALADSDIFILRKSFELIKADAVDIGALGVQHIFKKIPEASLRFCRNISPDGDGSHTQWAMMENGFVFLSGIERCLLRLNRSDTFEMYVESLTAAHILNYKIRGELLVQSLREFEMVLLTFLQHIQLSHDLDLVLNIWQKFFNLLCGIISATEKNISFQQQRQNSDAGNS